MGLGDADRVRLERLPPPPRAHEVGHTDRVGHPPKGREGGGEGAAGLVGLTSGETLRPKGFQIIPDGDHLLLHLPGGGGMGDPTTRDPDAVGRDVRDGLVSIENAALLYKVVVDTYGVIDTAATAHLRSTSHAL